MSTRPSTPADTPDEMDALLDELMVAKAGLCARMTTSQYDDGQVLQDWVGWGKCASLNIMS